MPMTAAVVPPISATAMRQAARIGPRLRTAKHAGDRRWSAAPHAADTDRDNGANHPRTPAPIRNVAPAPDRRAHQRPAEFFRNLGNSPHDVVTRVRFLSKRCQATPHASPRLSTPSLTARSIDSVDIKQFQQHHAQRIDVAAHVDFIDLAAELFRAHVAARAGALHQARFAARVRLAPMAMPKSMIFGIGLPSTSAISTLLGFQIAMDDAALVRMLHAHADAENSSSNSRSESGCDA